MRVKRIDRSPHIVLNMEEAKQIKAALDDHLLMGSTSYGFEESKEKLEQITNALEEALLRADATE